MTSLQVYQALPRISLLLIRVGYTGSAILRRHVDLFHNKALYDGASFAG